MLGICPVCRVSLGFFGFYLNGLRSSFSTSVESQISICRQNPARRKWPRESQLRKKPRILHWKNHDITKIFSFPEKLSIRKKKVLTRKKTFAFRYLILTLTLSNKILESFLVRVTLKITFQVLSLNFEFFKYFDLKRLLR